ncbi:hypothetical protein SEA_WILLIAMBOONE_54 [Gordonia phage WilliamBoone]|nr:hypothetical protein SEA_WILLIAMBOONE_54 [Gordonia phage WilliamBoone]
MNPLLARLRSAREYLVVAAYTIYVITMLALMLPTNTLREWGNVWLATMAALVTTFTLAYATRSAFWKNKIGWIFMCKSVLLSAVLIQVSLSSITSSAGTANAVYYPGRDYIRLVIYAGGAIGYAVMLAALLAMQRKDRTDHLAQLLKDG